MRHKNFSLCLALGMVLIAGLMPRPANADDGEKAIPEWRRATSHFEPIGIVQSLGRVTVDGRPLELERVLWGGELLEVADGASARVRLHSVGQVTLSGGAAVRVSVRKTGTGEHKINGSLVASLINGQMAVDLRPEASAYIETQNSMLVATGGAKFRARASESETQVYNLGGEVRVEPRQIWEESRYILNPTHRDPGTGNFLKNAPDTLYTLGPVEWAMQISRRKKPKLKRLRKSFMPEQDQPAADLVVRFTLDPPTFGRLDPEITTTNQYGVAYTNFTPLTNRGEARIITTVVENPVDTHEGKIVLGKPPGIFRTRNIIIGAAALAAITIATIVDPGKKRPVERVPPIIINP